MKKTYVFTLMFFATIFFTGCLEDLLSSLCDKLASNNSIVAVLQVSDQAVYSNKVARLTYTNTSNSLTLTFSECDSEKSYQFPKGERKNNGDIDPQNITFVNVLDEVSNGFFFELNGNPKSVNYSLNIEFFDDCTQMNVAAETPQFTSSPANLSWEDVASGSEEEIPLIGECEVTGQAAVVTVSEIL